MKEWIILSNNTKIVLLAFLIEIALSYYQYGCCILTNIILILVG